MERMENPGMKKETKEKKGRDRGRGGDWTGEINGKRRGSGNKLDTGLKDKKLEACQGAGERMQSHVADLGRDQWVTGVMGISHWLLGRLGPLSVLFLRLAV